MTYKDLFELIANINANIGDQTTKGKKKLYKIYEKVKPLIDEYQAKVEDLKLEYASVDESGHLIIDDKGGYKYTKEKLKEFNAEFKKLEEVAIDFNVIDVANPAGLEDYNFLDKWVNGVVFNIKEEQEEEL